MHYKDNALKSETPMDMTKFEQDYNEFCELFAGLTVEQAKAKAENMGLPVNYDDGSDLVDIDYKNICATVCKDKVSDCYECYDENDNRVAIVD